MMNAKVVLLIVGLVVGGLAGWLTRPEAAEIKLGPVQIEVQGSGTAQGGGSMTSSQTEHVALFALAGAVVGFAVGFVLDRRKPA